MALSFGLRGVESRRQDCRQRIPPSAKPPICLSLQIDSTLFKDLPPEYQLQFKSNSNFWRMKSFWIFTYLTEATIETQCCAKGKLSPLLQNRGSTKNWHGKIAIILFYTDRPNSLIPSPFLSNISLPFRLADNFKGCSDTRLSKLFHIQRNGQRVQQYYQPKMIKWYFLLKTVQTWSQYGFVQETCIRGSWALFIELGVKMSTERSLS